MRTSKSGASTTTTRRIAPKPFLPKALSVGEETLALHLRADGIEFQREVELVPGRKWRWDFWLRDADLAIEISGQIWQKGGHSNGAGLLRDYRKNNTLVLRGGKCLYFATEQVLSGEAIDCIRAALGVSTPPTL
jgi:hypothetical protein